MSRPPFGFDAARHERHRVWRGVLFKLLPCLAISAVLVWWLGAAVGSAVAVLVLVRFIGPALAPELVALGAAVWRAMRMQAFRPVQGRFYQFKGHRIRVEDDELLPQRWLALDDLATALGQPWPAVTLRRRWPDGCRQQRDGFYVLDDVALAWLSEQRQERAGRLQHWVARDVWYPARGRKASYTPKGAPAGAPRED